MKCIIYKFKSTMQIVDENGDTVDKDFIGAAKAEYSEEKLEQVKATAYNGEYTVYDDGQPEPETSSGDAVTWDELDTAYQEGVDSV